MYHQVFDQKHFLAVVKMSEGTPMFYGQSWVQQLKLLSDQILVNMRPDLWPIYNGPSMTTVNISISR